MKCPECGKEMEYMLINELYFSGCYVCLRCSEIWD